MRFIMQVICLSQKALYISQEKAQKAQICLLMTQTSQEQESQKEQDLKAIN